MLVSTLRQILVFCVFLSIRQTSPYPIGLQDFYYKTVKLSYFTQLPTMFVPSAMTATFEIGNCLPSSPYYVLATQYRSHFLSFSLKKRSTPLPTIILKPTNSIGSHVVFRGVVSPSSSNRFSVTHCQSLRDLANFTSSASNSSPNWNPPLRSPLLIGYPKGQVPLNHWIVMMELTGYEFETEHALFNFYISTLAAAIGSVEEAKKRIYFVSCEFPFGFGAEIDEETVAYLEDQLNVRYVLEDQWYEARKNDSEVSSVASFCPLNRNHRLDDIFSYHHLSECNSKRNSDHWLVHIKQPDGEFITKQQTVDMCVRMLAHVVGSEEDARKKIYMVWCKTPFGFGAEIDKQTLNKLKGLPDVLIVLPDYAFDVNLRGCALVISPSSRLKSDYAYYYYYQPSEAHFAYLEESIEEPRCECDDSVYSPWMSGHKHRYLMMEKPGGEFYCVQHTLDCIEEPIIDKWPFRNNVDEAVNQVRPPTCFTLTGQNRHLGNIFSYHHLSGRNLQWNSDHWLIVIKRPKEGFTMEGKTLDFCIKILSEFVGSEQEAKKKIYIIWCKFPLGFGAEIDEETSNKLKGCADVLKVLPDYAFDVKDKANGALFVSSSCEGPKFSYYNVSHLEYLAAEDVHFDPNRGL